MEMCYTALYSPSQNGIAKQMNCTPVELSQAITIANDLPEFLWEYTVLHTAYLHNQSFTKHLLRSMPYKGWYNKKPSVFYLCEFCAPVCILLQGQKIDQKMQPKSNGKFMLVLMMVLWL